MLKELYIKLFKPSLYIIEKNKFLGDFSKKVTQYSIQNNQILTSEEALNYDQVYLLEKNAKKEINKTALQYDIKNVELAKQMRKAGIALSNYAYLQVLEDGEASEPYLKYEEHLKIHRKLNL